MVALRRLVAMTAVLMGMAALESPGALAQDRTETVRIPFPRDDGSLTPYTFRLGYPLVSLVYDTLMLRDARGRPRPWLARSVRREGLQIAIDLRRGARWHDGRRVTAADVAFTFNHVASRPHPRFTPQVRDVERVQVTGSHSLVVTLRRPSLGFFDQPLADMPILPAHLWRGLPRNQLAPVGGPVGSGPYTLSEYRPGLGYRFEANRRYFRGRPAVNRIQVPIIRRADRTFDALRARVVDAIPVSLPGGSTAGLGGLGVRLAEGPSYVGVVLMLNVRGAPFNRPTVRRAFAQALDLGRISSSVGGAPPRGATLPAESGYLHPVSPWAPKQTLHRYNPRAARVTVAEQALPPFPLLVARGDPIREGIARQVEIALQDVGVPTQLVEVSQRQLERAVGQDGARPTFAAAIWSAQPLASYDPAFLRAVFGDRARLNYSGYRSAKFERLADRVAAAPTRAARRRAVAAELRLLARDLPVIPLAFPPGSFAFRPAAYAGWTYVRGSGILEKRSFVTQRAAATRRARADAGEDRPASGPIGDPIDRTSDGGGSALPWVLGVGGLLLLLVGWRAFASTRHGRR